MTHEILRQTLANARTVRDSIVAHVPNKNIVEFAYRVVQAQSTVEAAKKALYQWHRKNGDDIQHRDL